MGNIFTNNKDSSELLLPVKRYEIDICNELENNKIQMLVGDQPIVYLKEDNYNIPLGVNEEEFNNTLANAYLMGII